MQLLYAQRLLLSGNTCLLFIVQGHFYTYAYLLYILLHIFIILIFFNIKNMLLLL